MKKLFALLFVTFFLLAALSCHREEYTPKPKALLRLEYPPHAYEPLQTPLPFQFEKSKYARFIVKTDSTFDLYYPQMKAKIYLTYSPVRNNLKKLLMDAEKLTYKHSIKADAFTHRDFINPGSKVFGRISYVSGNAASPLQFYLTDSTHHFLTGSLYFHAVPNYDSIRPPLAYIKKDIQHLMETFRWKNR